MNLSLSFGLELAGAYKARTKTYLRPNLRSDLTYTTRQTCPLQHPAKRERRYSSSHLPPESVIKDRDSNITLRIVNSGPEYRISPARPVLDPGIRKELDDNAERERESLQIPSYNANGCCNLSRALALAYPRYREKERKDGELTLRVNMGMYFSVHLCCVCAPSEKD